MVILAIQPDSAQSNAVRQALRESADAHIVVVDSTEAALRVIDARVPDLILVHAFIPPAEADDLVDYLRMRPGAECVQTICVPLIQSSTESDVSTPDRGGLRELGHRWLKRPQRSAMGPAWWDPQVFATDVFGYLSRTQVIRELRQRLFKRTERPATSPAAWDPQAFATDVFGYLSRTHVLRAQIEVQKAARESPGTAERRRAARLSPPDLPFVSRILFATERADLINLSSGGALIRTAVRPLPRRTTPRDPQSLRRSTLTLSLPSGDPIRQTGRPVRCHVLSPGDGHVVYEVAFQFDQSLDLQPCVALARPGDVEEGERRDERRGAYDSTANPFDWPRARPAAGPMTARLLRS